MRGSYRSTRMSRSTRVRKWLRRVVRPAVVIAGALPASGLSAEPIEMDVRDVRETIEKIGGLEAIGLLFVVTREGEIYKFKAEDAQGRQVEATVEITIQGQDFPGKGEVIVIQDTGSAQATHCPTTGGSTECTTYTLPLP